MMRPTSSAADVALQLQRMAAAFGRPFGRSADKTVQVYATSLAMFDTATLEEAVDRACATLERWPAPATLRKLCLQVVAARPRHAGDTPRERYRRWLGHPADDPCPVCGQTMAWTPRLYAQCDPDAHAVARVRASAVAPDRVEAHRQAWRAVTGRAS